MAKPSDLSAEAAAGYANAGEGKNPYIYSSPSYYAWELGAWLKANAKPLPQPVRMSVGDSIRAGDWRFKFSGDAGRGMSFDRVA